MLLGDLPFHTHPPIYSSLLPPLPSLPHLGLSSVATNYVTILLRTWDKGLSGNHIFTLVNIILPHRG